MAHPWWPPTVLNRHHQSALVHHAKALSYLRSDIERYGVDGRTTMAATLLFIVFEYMQGNYHSSGNLIRHGIKVLSNIRGTSGGPESTLHHQRSRYLAATRDEIDEMADMFARHSTACAYIPFAHGKFAYHLLFTEEDKDELDYQGFPDGPDPYTFDVPQTLEQARRKWDYLLPLLANFHNKAVWHNLHRDYDFDDESSFREQALYLAQLRDFGEALDSLVLFSSGDSRDSRALELLRLHHRLATIFMQCCLDATDMTYDDFLPQFRDVLRRCRALTGALSSAAAAVATPTRAAIKVGFTNEAGVLFLLAFVGVKCRARRVRLEVLDLLRRHEWREGGWDGTTLASVLKGLMRLEGQSPTADDGLDIGGPAVGVGVNSTETEVFPLPETRYTWTNMFWDFEHRRMSVEYTRVLPNSIGKHERMTHVMDA
ncbi:hypothetical protein F5Y15DRAFT_382591 [Xylariaceae sp. FL0016]|nr:hypothetical protein F5Y15DRAFT_382591 [Xylariaceae sp. FL0016]